MMQLKKCAVWMAGMALLLGCGPAMAQSSLITYQGSLKNSGTSADGQFDFAFSLFNASSGGTQIGTSATNLNVSVSNGLFTTTLDFGTNAYAGGSRWLDISVRTNGSVSGFIPLMPRQLITAAPLAVFALTGNPGPAGTSGTNGATGTTGQNATTVTGSAALTVSTTTLTPVPGLTQTVTVPSNCMVYISADGGAATQSTIASGFSQVELLTVIDGGVVSPGGTADVTALNNAGKTSLGSTHWSISFAIPLTPGIHTIAIYAYLFAGSPATVSGNAAATTQGGELTVMFLKK